MRDAVPVSLQDFVVDVFGRKLADVRVHAILEAEEDGGRRLGVRLTKALAQPCHQGLVVAELFRLLSSQTQANSIITAPRGVPASTSRQFIPIPKVHFRPEQSLKKVHPNKRWQFSQDKVSPNIKGLTF